ncbi:MAG TPA: hypothetical protein VMX54_13685 [Vicinamibacteria bacterium]|nr:hypothetical protein [Vicinamibacteria bacterium]
MSDPTRLAAWGNFYVIVGSSGGALIGIQFVVITLIAGMRHRAEEAVSAFATPTVVHFAAALLVSAIMSAPWPALAQADVALAACGLGGLAYAVAVIRRARRQTDYRPVWEDWLWYAVLPCGAYLALSMSALFLRSAAALYVIAASALSLLLIGVHNAWDSVTHLVLRQQAEEPTAPPK